MPKRRSLMGKTISDIIPPANIQQSVIDLEEVTYIRAFQGHDVASARPKRAHPLVDLVNPQPRAFFAYLQMPEKKAEKTSKTATKRKRISRPKKGEK